MEDLSRDLEDEINTRRKATRKRQKKNQRLIFIDDFGKIQSADWMKTIVFLLTGISLVSLATAVWFYSEYSKSAVIKRGLSDQLQILQTRTQTLIEEKERLLARLVLTGGLQDPGEFPEPAGLKNTGEPGETTSGQAQESPIKNQAAEAFSYEKVGESSGKPLPEISEETVIPSVENDDNGYDNGAITIEDFRLSKDENSETIYVRFDIRNKTSGSKALSGYAFVILKPDILEPKSWLVTPMVNLENGLPASPKQGQFFSITNFKPMNFKIKTETFPEMMTSADIFVYRADTLSLLVEKTINLSE